MQGGFPRGVIADFRGIEYVWRVALVPSSQTRSRWSLRCQRQPECTGPVDPLKTQVVHESDRDDNLAIGVAPMLPENMKHGFGIGYGTTTLRRNRSLKRRTNCRSGDDGGYWGYDVVQSGDDVWIFWKCRADHTMQHPDVLRQAGCPHTRSVWVCRPGSGQLKPEVA